MEYLSQSLSNLELKFSEKVGEITGYASVYNVLDSKNDIILPGAYRDVLSQGDSIPAFVNHTWKHGALPVGTWTGLKEDDIGLKGTLNLVMGMPSAQDAYWSAKSGIVTGLSVAIIPDHSTITKNNSGNRMIKNIIHMKEISIVDSPANPDTRITTVKSDELEQELDDIKSIKEFEYFLRDSGGFSRSAAQMLISKAKAIFRDEKEEITPDYEQIVKRLSKISGLSIN